jgi:hypothetical protein
VLEFIKLPPEFLDGPLKIRYRVVNRRGHLLIRLAWSQHHQTLVYRRVRQRAVLHSITSSGHARRSFFSGSVSRLRAVNDRF